MIHYLKQGEPSPFPPDLILQNQGVISKTDRGDLHGDLYWSEEADTGWVIAYDATYQHWAYTSAYDYEIDKCCE